MRTRVKICGITRTEDALAAAENGADAIGFVFHEPSPRHVTVAAAVAISRVLPPFLTRVGLFVDAETQFVEHALATNALDLLQFHGDESPEYCDSFGRPYIKAIAMRDGVDLVEQAKRYAAAAGLLVDAYSTEVKGGSGKKFDWSLFPREPGKPLILAGGLTPENVSDAVRQLHPYAVDVSSGVERSKGIKDADKIAAFMKEVNQFI